MNLHNDPFGKGKTVQDLIREQEATDRIFNINPVAAERDAVVRLEARGKDMPLNEDSLRFMAAIGTGEGLRDENKVPHASGDGKTVDQLFHEVETTLTVEGIQASLAKVAPNANQNVLRLMAEQVVKDHGKK